MSRLPRRSPPDGEAVLKSAIRQLLDTDQPGR